LDAPSIQTFARVRFGLRPGAVVSHDGGQFGCRAQNLSFKLFLFSMLIFSFFDTPESLTRAPVPAPVLISSATHYQVFGSP
jgi:hypothetical protein